MTPVARSRRADIRLVPLAVATSLFLSTSCHSPTPQPDPVADWPRLGHDAARTVSQAVPSLPIDGLRLIEVLHLPEYLQYPLIADVRGGEWLDLVPRGGSRVEVLDLQSSTTHHLLRPSGYHVGHLDDLDGDGKKDIIAVRATRLERSALLGVSGKGEVLFEHGLDLGGCAEPANLVRGPDGRIYGVIITPSPTERRSVFAYDVSQGRVDWTWTHATLHALAAAHGPAGETLLTFENNAVGNGIFGDGLVEGRDRYTWDTVGYAGVLSAGEPVERFMEPLPDHGNYDSRFWKGSLLTIQVRDRRSISSIGRITLRSLDGGILAEQRFDTFGEFNPYPGGYANLVVFADIDGDGSDEAVVCRTDVGEMIVYRQPGLQVAAVARFGPVQLRGAADMDGDGVWEILASTRHSLLVLDGHLNVRLEHPVELTRLARIADIDRDGYLEIVVSTEDGLRVFATVPGPLAEAGPIHLSEGDRQSEPIRIDENRDLPETPWELFYLISALDVLEAIEETGELRNVSPEGREEVLRWFQERPALVIRAAHFYGRRYVRMKDRVDHMRRADRIQGEARLIDTMAREATGDTAPGRLLRWYLEQPEENLRNVDEAFGLWIAHGEALNRDDPEGALSALEESVAAYGHIGETLGQSYSLVDLAILHMDYGRFEEALEAADEAIRLKEPWNDMRGISRAHRVRGEASRAMGDFGTAVAALQDARDVAVEARDASLEADADTAMGRLYLDLGMDDEARQNLEQARSLRERRYDYRELARIERQLAEVEILSGRPERAAKLLERPEKVFRDLQLRRELAQVYLSRAKLLMTSDRSRARLALQNAVKIGRDENLPVITAQGLAGLAGLAMEAGDEAVAEARAREAGRLARVMGMRDLAWRCEAMVAGALAAAGRLEEALKRYESAIRDVDRFRGEIDAERLRFAFLGTHVGLFEGALEVIAALAADSDDPDLPLRALWVLESFRARSLADKLHGRRDPGVEDSAVGEIRARLSLLQRELWNPTLTAEARRSIEQRLLKARCELDGRCAVRTGELAPGLLPAAAPREPAELVQTLQRNDVALVEYFLGDKTRLAIVVADGQIRIVPLPADPSLDRLARQYLVVLQDAADWAGTAEAGAQLASVLLDPVGEFLPSPGRSVAFVPDGPLFRLPPGALPDPRTGKPLLEAYPVYAVPSGSVLATLLERAEQHERRDWNLDFLGVGTSGGTEDPATVPRLDHVSAEVRDLAGTFPPERTRTLLGGDARESEFTRLASKGSRVVHVAAHAFWPRGAEAPSIRLAGDDLEDGLLTPAELHGRSVPCEVVYLSGCSTGTGKQVAGEGVVGLTRAFLGAGAFTVVASLWDVEDEAAARFARRFYDRWLEGEAVSTALARSQSELEREGFPPREWAGFVILGDGRTRGHLSSENQAKPSSEPSSESTSNR